MAHWETSKKWDTRKDEQKNYRTYGLTVKKTKIIQFGGYNNEIEVKYQKQHNYCRIKVSQTVYH